MITLRTKNRNEVEEYLSEHKIIRVNPYYIINHNNYLLSISQLFYKTNCNIDGEDIENYIKIKNINELYKRTVNAKLGLVINRN